MNSEPEVTEGSQMECNQTKLGFSPTRMICSAKSTLIGLVAKQAGNDIQRIVSTDF